MNIEWLRDLIIIICGLAITVAVIFIAVLAFQMYSRLKPVMDSLKATTKRVDDIVSCVEVEITRPLAQLASFIQGVRQAVNLVSGFKKRKETDNE